MKKWIKKCLWTLLVVIIVVAVFYSSPRLPILTGYASKNLASGIFVSGRTQEQVENQELNFFPVNLAANRVDYDNKIVTSSLLGLAKRRAVYREGLGCVSVIGYTAEELKAVEKSEINPFSCKNSSHRCISILPERGNGVYLFYCEWIAG